MAGPHEVLGMSRLLGMTTTEFLALHADNGGTTLRFGEDGRCVFVTPAGCKVHARRPLVCRLYPLGRATDGAGDERFALFPKQDGCEAAFGTDGTIADFLKSQGVAPYLEWSRRYGELYRRMMGLLESLDIRSKVEAGAGGAPDRAPISPWQDIAASLAEYCAAKGLTVPAGVEESIDLHLRAMREWLDGLEGRIGSAEGDPEGAKER
jgi:Fe-S-cluster containining protein